MFTTTRITAAIAVIAVAIAAGTSLAGPPATGETVTLTLANPESQGRPASQIAERFARTVATRSKGTVKVRIVYEAGRTTQNTPTREKEANLVRMVRTGKTQLAIVPNRAFQAQGITSFQALQTPFLITTDSQMARATTGRIANTLMSGLPTIGLQGLGLVPEGLRRPFGFSKPLVTPADFRGIKIRAIYSKATYDLIRALGATPIDLNGSDFDAAVEKGVVKGAESSFGIAVDGLPAASYTVGNIAFFPKVDALVVNAKALAGLTTAQQAILRNAAADARAATLSTTSERKAAAAYCRTGNGTIVHAPSSSLQSLRSKVAAVIVRLRKDPLTRNLIDSIDKLPSQASSIAACTPKADATAGPSATVTSLIPAGTYRKKVTEAALLAAGASPKQARENVGTWTLKTTADGRQTVSIVSPHPEWTTTCDSAMMRLARGLVVIDTYGSKCGGSVSVAWKPATGGIEFVRSVPNDWIQVVWSGIWKTVS